MKLREVGKKNCFKQKKLLVPIPQGWGTESSSTGLDCIYFWERYGPSYILKSLISLVMKFGVCPESTGDLL